MTGHEFAQNPYEKAVMLGEDLTQWQSRMDSLMTQDGAHIITIRGAGTANGIDERAADTATIMLHDYVTSLSSEGRPVALIFDGDGDNRAKPDVGSVFGGLVDSLQDNPDVAAICAQTKSWYYPKTEGDALRTASGNPYETYIFDDHIPGSHTALTQSESLVNYPGYEQVFVGAAGKIAYDQLSDLSDKALSREVKVTILKAPLNPDPEIDKKLAAQLASASDHKKETIRGKITQRAELPYGTLFTEDGNLTDQVVSLPGVRLKTLTVEPHQNREARDAVNPNELRKKMDNVLQRGTPAEYQ